MPENWLSEHWPTAMTLGVLLAAALVGGLVGQMLRLPRVVAYLLIGLLLGPQVLNAVTTEALHTLETVGKFAISLVLFNMGCRFTVPHFRRLMPRVLYLSAGELVLTFVLVAVGLFMLCRSWQAGVLFGALALATAPATTILVLKEYESEGPVTEYATALVAMNNLVAVVVFELLFLLVQFTDGEMRHSIGSALGQLGGGLFGSVMLGLVGGLVVSYACGLLSPRHWLVLLVAATTLILGLCEKFEFPYLLAFLTMGVTVANASDSASEMEAELDRLTGLLCVVFFVLHGAELDFKSVFAEDDATLVYIALAYIVLRGAGKCFGVHIAARLHHNVPQVRRWLGAAMLSQAGAALALSSIAADPETGLGDLGRQLQIIIVSTVVVFELVGPIMIRQAVLQSGEVPLFRAIRHRTTTPMEELRRVARRLLTVVGRDPRRGRSPERLNVGQLMFRNVKTVPTSAMFNDVVDFIEASADSTYPVVDPGGSLVGVIRYPDIRDAMFNPEMAKIVSAVDLASPTQIVLYADDSAEHAWAQFRECHDDCIFVITHEEPVQLVGLVKRRDLMGLFARPNDR
ncbi:MAG: sodium:proton exchanger [Phycisphaeraceae bacterium]|nr:sodium:proton exchanger [Phycisphaeraceae bacterium]